MRERDKASFIAGMVRAFYSAGWPDHFTDEMITKWKMCGMWAGHILEDGAYNPLNIVEVINLFDKEMDERISSNNGTVMKGVSPATIPLSEVFEE
jgi:hypothetical protein